LVRLGGTNAIEARSFDEHLLLLKHISRTLGR
jgi:hypothetical protein